MHQWQIYLEPADTDKERRYLGEVTADTMSNALQKASEYWERPSHDLVVVETQGDVLRVPVVPTSKPCEECGASPALQYSLVSITGVLCRKCLQEQVDAVNRTLKETSQEEE